MSTTDPTTPEYATRVELQAVLDRQAQYEKACEDDRRLLRNDVTKLTEGMARVENKTDKVDIKVDKVDAKTDAQTVQLNAQTVQLTQLATKADATLLVVQQARDAVVGVARFAWSNPKFRAVVYATGVALATAVNAWLASKGIKVVFQ